MMFEIQLTENQTLLMSNTKFGELAITIDNGDDQIDILTDKGDEIIKALSMLGYDLPSEKSVKK